MTKMTVTINGKAYGPFDVRDELSMNDFLREYLGLTGTKFGCGLAQCLSCAVIIDNADGTSQTSPTCVVPAVEFHRQVDPHRRGPCQERPTLRAAKSFRRTLFVSVRLLHARLLERGPGAARTPGEERRSRAPSSTPRSATRSTAICAAAPATSNTTRRCAT